MKRIAVLLFALTMLLTSCVPSQSVHGDETAATYTESPTDAPSELPTSEPSELSSELPSAEPSFEVNEFPDFSDLIPKTGRLVDGPIFPEPYKYLVLSGESDMHYVYNNMGELLYSFSAFVDEEGDPPCSGLFTADGISCWHRLKDNTVTTPFRVFHDLAVTVKWFEDEDGFDSHACITLIRDLNLENPREFAKDELNLGDVGGIMKLKDKYIVVNRDYDSIFGDDDECCDTITVYDSSLNKIGTLDPELFRGIAGIYADKYIICLKDLGEDYWTTTTYSLYTPEGELVMDDVIVYRGNSFCLDSEMGSVYGFFESDFLTDKDGNNFDRELKPIDEIPDIYEYYKLPSRFFGAYEADGYVVYDRFTYRSSDVYSGIKDKDGNWVFRIYSPAFASDSDNTRWGFFDD
ncbi:MAG: PT domain-containing protein [Clostridia bacterium]|nr:PT domain-containing protein [Clostridia bacterium]